MSNILKTSMTAPAFTLKRDGGGTIGLDDFTGRKLVIFFYPKDNTPGCTKQAISFSEFKNQFQATDTDIIGISADTVKRHENFIAKHNLTIPLGADPDLGTLKAYGVWAEKSMFGRKYMGIVRTTFLIDRSGKIAEIWQKVKVQEHVEEVLQACKKLA